MGAPCHRQGLPAGDVHRIFAERNGLAIPSGSPGLAVLVLHDGLVQFRSPRTRFVRHQMAHVLLDRQRPHIEG